MLSLEYVDSLEPTNEWQTICPDAKGLASNCFYSSI